MKLHWSEGREAGDIMWVTLCGQMVAEVALAPDEVTCKLCQRRLAEAKPSNADAAEYLFRLTRGRASFSPPPPLVDPISDLPFLTPMTWRVANDRHHWCGDCAVCRWFTRMAAEHNARPWQKLYGTGRAARFHSTFQALEWFVQYRLASPGVQAQDVSRIGKLGTIVSGGDRKDARAIQEADDAHTIERALDTLYRSESTRGLSREVRLVALLEVATGRKPHTVARRLVAEVEGVERLTGPMVAAIATDGKYAAFEFLKPRGMVEAL